MLIGRYKTASYKACEAMYLFQAVFVQNSGIKKTKIFVAKTLAF